MSRILKFRAWEETEKKMYKCIVGNNDNEDNDFICPMIWIEGKECSTQVRKINMVKKYMKEIY